MSASWLRGCLGRKKRRLTRSMKPTMLGCCSLERMLLQEKAATGKDKSDNRYGRWGVMTSADPQSQAKGKRKLTLLLRAAACPAGSSWRS